MFTCNKNKKLLVLYKTKQKGVTKRTSKCTNKNVRTQNIHIYIYGIYI